MGPCTSPFSLSGARLLWFVMVAAAALTGCSKSSGHKHDTQKVAPLAVRTWQSRPGNISKKIQYIGTIHSIDENSVLARLPGTLLSLPAQEGEVIKKGQLIAKISTETMDEQGRNLWATYQRAKLDRDYLCHQSNIDQKLGKTGVLTAAAVDVSLHRCNMSKKSTVGILASVSEFYASKAKSLEKSPFSGRVLKWLAQPGEHVFAGKPLLTLGGTLLEVRVPVNEFDLARGIHAGMPVQLRFNSPKATLMARVTVVKPMARGVGRIIDVHIAIPQENGKGLIHGSSVDVDFILKHEEGVTILPQYALLLEGTRSFIYQARNNRAEKVRVYPSIQGGEWVSLTSKLSNPQDPIIVSNLEMLTPGRELYPVPSPGLGGEPRPVLHPNTEKSGLKKQPR